MNRIETGTQRSRAAPRVTANWAPRASWLHPRVTMSNTPQRAVKRWSFPLSVKPRILCSQRQGQRRLADDRAPRVTAQNSHSCGDVPSVRLCTAQAG